MRVGTYEHRQPLVVRLVVIVVDKGGWEGRSERDSGRHWGWRVGRWFVLTCDGTEAALDVRPNL